MLLVLVFVLTWKSESKNDTNDGVHDFVDDTHDEMLLLTTAVTMLMATISRVILSSVAVAHRLTTAEFSPPHVSLSGGRMQRSV